MLQSRGFPKSGYLFVSFRGEQLGVRGINDMLKAVVTKGFNGKAKEWKTKHLRDAFMNALLQGKITQEVKDAMVGHKRQGARNDYAITELTVKTAYAEAFKYLTINGYGSQSRKLEELQKQLNEDKAKLENRMNEDRDALMTVIKNQQSQLTEQQVKLDVIYNFINQWQPQAEQQLKRLENAKEEFEKTNKKAMETAEKIKKIAEQQEQA
jgi:chromosome segregation ATPase